MVALAYSTTGRLACCDADGRVYLWDVETGEPLGAYDFIRGARVVAFAPDGLTCAAGGDNGQVVVWDVDV
ncbi:MAG: hypothetical protein K2V38_20010 [Gemmataceae bacterium]|nr:hypothetical protein [Gemmataceae bacterium]